MDGVRHALEDIKTALGAQERMGRFREQAQQRAIEKMTDAVAQLAQSVDRAVRLNREVARDGQRQLETAAKQVKEVTGEFKTLPKESEEQIAVRVAKRWAWKAVGTWAAKHAGALIIGGLAAVGAAIWAYLKAKLN